MADDAPTRIGRALRRNCGEVCEGDVFSILKASPYVIRSSEFAPLDGAIDCDPQFDHDSTYADRFHSVTSNRFPGDRPKLVLFDVKGTASRCPIRAEHFCFSPVQLACAGFFIRICAKDPSFVEVQPNTRQETGGSQRSTTPAVAAPTNLACYLPPGAYNLDPRTARYRMPLRYLCQAIKRIRELVVHGTPYVNPWTLVQFDWRPGHTDTVDKLAPSSTTHMYTSYLAVDHLFRFFKAYAGETGVTLDVMGLQPRLADFRLVLKQGPSQLERFVQHKVDSQARTFGQPLRRVCIRRASHNNEPATTWFFRPYDRFDFLWIQFEFQVRRCARPYREFMLLPESVLPDEFYTTSSDYVSFERDEFRPYRIHLDHEGQWVSQVRDILAAIEHPRRRGLRPERQLNASKPAALDKANDDKACEVGSSGHKHLAEQAKADMSPRGSQLYVDVTKRGQHKFFYSMLSACAARRSGLLLVLSSISYCYIRYTWTSEEVANYTHTGRPPLTLSDFPGDTPAVLIAYHPRTHAEGSPGPCLMTNEFQSLDATALARLIIWDMSGGDHTIRDRPCPPAVVPSVDVRPTESQRLKLAHYMQEPQDTASYTSRVGPTITSTLSTGLFIADYAASCQGPAIYSDGYDWPYLLGLVDQFASQQSFMYPTGSGILRSPAMFRHNLSAIL